MSIAIGTRIDTYEIAARLGAGGMGEVYRARDSKLNRDVALNALAIAGQIVDALETAHAASIVHSADRGGPSAAIDSVAKRADWNRARRDEMTRTMRGELPFIRYRFN